MLGVLLISVVSAVVLDCQDAKKESDCKSVVNGIYECIWAQQLCVRKTCVNSTPPCDGLVQANTACFTTNTQTCAGAPTCAAIDNANSCKIVKANGKICQWDNQCREQLCSDLTECSAVNGHYCANIGGTCQIATQCNQLGSTICNTAKITHQCQLYNGVCQDFSCKVFTTVKECFEQIQDKSVKCFNTAIQGVNCQSCDNFANQLECEIQAIYGCAWQNEKCQRNMCDTQPDRDTCNNAFDQKSCTWYDSTSQCVTFDEARRLDQLCDIYVFAYQLGLPLLLILLMH